MKKIFIKFFGVMFFIFAVTSTGYAEKNNSFELVIFHTNDIHGRILPTDDRGKSIDIAEITATVKNFKSEHPETLWFDAGDTFHGMPNINISHGQGMLDILNVAGIDAMTPGNHDFNYGVERLQEIIKTSKFSVLSANIVMKNNHKKNFCRPYKIFKFDGVKIGVFALTTPETATKAKPNLIKGLDFLNPNDIAKDMVKKLRPQCDILIAITHLGVDPNSEFTTKRLADEVAGIDLIVDGHSHTTLPEGITVKNTLIVQTGCYANNLGKVTLKIENKKVVEKSAELLDKNTIAKNVSTPDETVSNVLKKIEQDNEKIFSKEVGTSDKKIDFDIVDVRLFEKEIGDVVTDAFRWKTGADIAIINGGGIRGGIPQGSVNYRDVISIFPFGNVLNVIEVDGKTIREMLENSISKYPASSGGFLQISGMKFLYDPSQPAGNRVTAIYVNNMPLDEEKIYRLTLTDFLEAGGDNYKMFKDKNLVGQFGTCEEVLADYLHEVGIKDIEQGRIIKIKEVQMPAEYFEYKAKQAA